MTVGASCRGVPVRAQLQLGGQGQLARAFGAFGRGRQRPVPGDGSGVRCTTLVAAAGAPAQLVTLAGAVWRVGLRSRHALPLPLPTGSPNGTMRQATRQLANVAARRARPAAVADADVGAAGRARAAMTSHQDANALGCQLSPTGHGSTFKSPARCSASTVMLTAHLSTSSSDITRTADSGTAPTCVRRPARNRCPRTRMTQRSRVFAPVLDWYGARGRAVPRACARALPRVYARCGQLRCARVRAGCGQLRALRRRCPSAGTGTGWTCQVDARRRCSRVPPGQRRDVGPALPTCHRCARWFLRAGSSVSSSSTATA
jgi:hypothetical protein